MQPNSSSTTGWKSSSRPKKILITPNVAAPYDQRMVNGLAEGFNQLGQHGYASAKPLSSEELSRMCKEFGIDIVIQVNKTRDPEHPLPPNIRHIAWVQDVFPETLDGFSECFHESDILYALSDPGVLGLNVKMPCYVDTLFTGVDAYNLNFNPKNKTQNLDFSLCGGLPPPVNINPNLVADVIYWLDKQLGKIPVFGHNDFFKILRRMAYGRYFSVEHVSYAEIMSILNIVETFYRPLKGELDIHLLAEAMLAECQAIIDHGERPQSKSKKTEKSSFNKLIKEHCPNYIGRSDWKARLIRYLSKESSLNNDDSLTSVQKVISYFSQSYPRIMDRKMLIELASKVSDSLELYGNTLDAFDFARPYFKGVATTQEELLEIYCRSKINLNNNTHGLGLHSRTLECMGVGGFIFMHESPHDRKPGGMLTAFEPGVHFGSYTPENFHEQAERWLKDDKKRIQIGKKAKSIIKDQHCWQHRAQQILNDLNK